MADLVTRLRLVNNEFNSSIDSSKKKVEELQDTTDDASKSIQDLGNRGSRSAKELLAEMAKTEQANRSTSNYNRQLKELQKTIADLTINYRAMSDEMKNSSLGQEVAAKIQELTAKASEYKDAIEDANASVRALASDTSTWDGMKQGIDTVSSALQGFVSLGVLGEESTDKLVKVIAQLKAVEAATNAVIKVGNALQRQSALMTSISAIQSRSLAKAKALEAASTGKATIAQKAFNIVAKANPYVLLAAAVIAVGAALFAFTKKQKEATDAEKKHQEALKNEKQAADEWASKVGNATGSVLSKYKLLQIEWSKLQTTSQKKKWISDNKNEFEQLGLKVNDVTSAEDTFVGNTSAVVEALKKRALAAAKQAQLTELYSQLIEAQTKAESEYNRRQVSAGSRVGGTNHTTAGGNEFVDRSGAWVYTAKGAEEANKRIRKEVYATANKIQSDIDALAADIAGSIDLSTIFKPSGGGNNNNAITAEVGSLQAAQNEVNRLQTLLNNMSPNNSKFETTKALLSDAKKEVERLKELLKESEPPKKLELVPNSLEEATYFVQSFSKELQKMDPGTDEFSEILELLNIWKRRQQEINNIIAGTKTETKTVVDQYKDITSKASDINLRFKIGEIDQTTAQSMINDLNKQLSDLGLTATVKLELDEKTVKTTTDKLRDFVGTMDKIGSLGNAVSSIDNVVNSITSLSKTIEEAENGWEQFFAIFQVGMNIFNAAATIIETVATVTELLSAAKNAATAATTSETAAVAADATAQATDAAATTTNAAAHGAAGAAKAGESVASIPYVGPVLAIAAIAAVMAAIIGVIASAKGFATGGIVDAPSKYGDKNIIRVNGGEMILNNRQQANLFKLLDEGRKDTSSNLGGDVEFKIQGTQLVGVLNNINRKNSKI